MLLNFKSIFALVALSLSGAAYAQSIAITHCFNINNQDTHSLESITKNMKGIYHLAHDIHCNASQGSVFVPIGNKSTSFSGTLNGNGYTVADLHIEYPAKQRDNPAGLFSDLQGATITNIRFENVEVYSRPDYDVGLIAGVANNAKISNITAQWLRLAPIEGAGKYATNSSGGLLGYSYGNTTLYNVQIQDMSIMRNKIAGGLIGRAADTTIAYANVSNLVSERIGCGIAADQMCAIGGLIGRVNGPVHISTSSVNGGKIHAVRNAGGLIGYINPEAPITIENSYSNTVIEINDYFGGGLIGQGYIEKNAANITLNNVFVIGKVIGPNKFTGTIIGRSGYDPINTRVKGRNSYFDTSVYALHEISGDNGLSKGLTTAQMQGPNDPNYFGQVDANGHYLWDRGIWTMENGQYPTLNPAPLSH